jgi:hypothetical protein
MSPDSGSPASKVSQSTAAALAWLRALFATRLAVWYLRKLRI